MYWRGKQECSVTRDLRPAKTTSGWCWPDWWER